MDGSLDPLDAYEPFSEASIAALIAHPRFRAACETSAAAGVAQFVSLGHMHRWLMKDIGRAGICLTATILHLADAGLTAQTLTAACLANEISSAGRVLDVIRRMENSDDLVITGGGGVWTRRRIELAPAFVTMVRERMLVELRALSCIWPRAAPFAESLCDEAVFKRYVLGAAAVANARRDLYALNDDPFIEFFLQREAGMLMLYDLLGRQAPGRERLLEAAPISRNALSQHYGVSRVHINKLLSGATAAGHLRCERTDLVVFAPAASRSMERMFAVVFELARTAARRTSHNAASSAGVSPPLAAESANPTAGLLRRSG